MQNAAYEGANRSVMVIGVYYASMVFFLVIFVQVKSLLSGHYRLCTVFVFVAAKYISCGDYRVICRPTGKHVTQKNIPTFKKEEKEYHCK